MKIIKVLSLVVISSVLLFDLCLADSPSERITAGGQINVQMKNRLEKSLNLLVKQDQEPIRIENADHVIGLLYHENDQVRRLAAYTLGELGDRLAVRHLIDMLNSDDPVECRIASRALGKIGDKRAVGPLMAVFTRPDAPLHVKAAVASSLGMMNDRRALQVLVRAAEKSDGWLRHEAGLALARISPDEYGGFDYTYTTSK